MRNSRPRVPRPSTSRITIANSASAEFLSYRGISPSPAFLVPFHLKRPQSGRFFSDRSCEPVFSELLRRILLAFKCRRCDRACLQRGGVFIKRKFAQVRLIMHKLLPYFYTSFIIINVKLFWKFYILTRQIQNDPQNVQIIIPLPARSLIIRLFIRACLFR